MIHFIGYYFMPLGSVYSLTYYKLIITWLPILDLSLSSGDLISSTHIVNLVCACSSASMLECSLNFHLLALSCYQFLCVYSSHFGSCLFYNNVWILFLNISSIGYKSSSHGRLYIATYMYCALTGDCISIILLSSQDHDLSYYLTSNRISSSSGFAHYN